MTHNTHRDPLSSLLLQADPLADDTGLSPLEVAQMRRKVIAAVPERHSSFWPQLSPALSAATLLAVALAVAWWPAATNRTRPVLLPSDEAVQAVESTSAETGIYQSGDALETRKIQFETPGGTLVVWVLNPNFPS